MIISFTIACRQLDQDAHAIFPLVAAVLPHHSCLIFAPTRKRCETLVSAIVALATAAQRAGTYPAAFDVSDAIRDARMQLLHSCLMVKFSH